MDNTVDITVFIALYNSEKYIEQTLNSLLNQTFTNFEILIINDASTDNSVEIVENFNNSKIRLIHNETNRGICYTRQRGVEEAIGKYIAIIDSDDIAMHNRLEKQFDFLENNPEFALCGTDAKFIDENNKEINHLHIVNHEPELIKIMLLFANQFINSSVLIKKEAVINVGGYIKSIAEDYDLFVRIAEKYKTANLKEKLVSYRMHNVSDSRTKKELYSIAEKEILAYQFKKLKIDGDLDYIPYLLFHGNNRSIKKKDLFVFFNTVLKNNTLLKIYDEVLFKNIFFKIWIELILHHKNFRQTWKLFLHPSFKFSELNSKEKRRIIKLLINPLKV